MLLWLFYYALFLKSYYSCSSLGGEGVALACFIVLRFCVQTEIVMAVEVVVGDHEQLLVKEGRNNISLIFFKFIGVVFLAGAIFYLSVSNFNTWMVEIEKCIFFTLPYHASL